MIVGNPPFLGGGKLRGELGDEYVENVRRLYEGRIPGGADLVAYWFERSRALIEQGVTKRAGLLATSSISGGQNQRVLERILQSGAIFMAWDDRPWVIEGASVRVAMVGFDDGTETACQFNGEPTTRISADLTTDIDLTRARRLRENVGIAFVGGMKKGAFDIDPSQAETMLRAPINPNGRPNSDVVRPWVNGLDITRRPRGMSIVDFGVDMSEGEAALYELPYAHVRQHVKPERDKVRNPLERTRWWLHGRSAPDLRRAITGLRRYIGTPRNGRYRLFVYVPADTLPDGQVVIVARDSDYWLGVLHARPHEIWSLRLGTWLGVGNDPRYTPSTTFETFPFPWPPGQEPQGDPRVEAIAAAAGRLVDLRNRWLNPEDADAAELKKRTLTNLYNHRPSWLVHAHTALDIAVFEAYGWSTNLTDEQILERLLKLNSELSN